MSSPVSDAARLQVTAGAVLLQKSHLLQWSATDKQFVLVEESGFEAEAEQVHDVFGRLMCWLAFSAGAEYLAKGVCLAHGIPFTKLGSVPKMPDPEAAAVEAWLKKTKGFPEQYGKTATIHYKTIGTLTAAADGAPPPLEVLAGMHGVTGQRLWRILGAYRLLGTAIRNRDDHAYIPNVRARHFGLVSSLFLPVLNQLVEWVPDAGGETVNDWLLQAKAFVQHVTLPL